MSLAKSALITVAIALGVLVLAFPFFHASLPACDPGQPDGQCGLATFLAVLYAVASSLAAALGAIVYFVIQHIRTRKPIEPAQ